MIYQEAAVGTSGVITIPDSTQLKTCRIKGLYVRPNVNDTGKSFKKVALPPPAVLSTGHIVLKNASGTDIFSGSAPLELFMKDFSTPDYFCLDIENLDTQNSYVQFDTAASGYAATDVLELTWIVECPAAC